MAILNIKKKFHFFIHKKTHKKTHAKKNKTELKKITKN